MNVTVWVVMTTGGGNDEAVPFASRAEAEAYAIEGVKAEWDRYYAPAPFPTSIDWEDVQQQMIDEDKSYSFSEITHHDLDLVSLINARKGPAEHAYEAAEAILAGEVEVESEDEMENA